MRRKASLIASRQPGLTLILGVFVTAAIIIGCGKVSPFSAGAFNTLFPGVPVAAGAGGGGGGVVAGDYTYFDDIPVELQTITSEVRNASPYPVAYRMLFIVTAGVRADGKEDGFVRNDADIQNYIRAGYRDVIAFDQPIGTSVSYSCNFIYLQRGSRLLVKEFGVGEGFGLPPLDANLETPDEIPPVGNLHVRSDNGSPLVPVPEFIAFISGDDGFECQDPSDTCTAVSFRFLQNNRPNPLLDVTSTRIQGTTCGQGTGRTPASRLNLDPTRASSLTQYPLGGAIVWVALDPERTGSFTDAEDPDPNRDVVWLVTDANGDIEHQPNDG
ncbi:MAG TPA: hypothetical protein P5081_11290 [Phycisphaerae bacterium]|nr:hypothetical protein [Phycisphaerae bacterium]HRW53464.1 hypothetical protein [Phycisphaerae bacterium]